MIIAENKNGAVWRIAFVVGSEIGVIVAFSVVHQVLISAYLRDEVVFHLHTTDVVVCRPRLMAIVATK